MENCLQNDEKNAIKCFNRKQTKKIWSFNFVFGIKQKYVVEIELAKFSSSASFSNIKQK